MSTTPQYLSPSEVAEIVGVSKARVHQRITGEPRDTSGTALDAELVRTGLTTRYRVPVDAALAWRAERAAQGLAVGPLSNELLAADRERMARQMRTTTQAAPIGLPIIRPF
jgi:hypothetical protein